MKWEEYKWKNNLTTTLLDIDTCNLLFFSGLDQHVCYLLPAILVREEGLKKRRKLGQDSLGKKKILVAYDRITFPYAHTAQMLDERRVHPIHTYVHLDF